MVIVLDYGGRAPQPDAPHEGAVQAWDLDAEVHHDYTTGADVTRPLNAGERQRFIQQLEAARRASILATLAAGVAELTSLQEAAEAAAAAEAARAAAVRATTPAATVAYVAAIRDDLALIHDRLGQVAAGLVLAYRDLAYLGRLAGREI